MTVKQFDPTQTTTMDTPKKVIEQQSQENSVIEGGNARVGFVSLGCPKR